MGKDVHGEACQVGRSGLENEDSFLAAVVECSNDAIITKSLDGIVTSWNTAAEKIFGYSAEEMIGQSITRIIPPRLLCEETTIQERLRRGERIEHYETERRRKGGELVEVSLTISPVKDRQGRLIGASKIARDITERKATEKALEAAKRELETHAESLEGVVMERTAQLREKIAELDRFAYSISHDLRTPIRAMRLYAETVLAECEAPLGTTCQSYLKRIQILCMQMEEMVLGVLAYSRVSTVEAGLRPTELEPLIQAVIEQNPMLQAPTAKVHVDGPIPSVMGNRVLLIQCLANLLENAAKYVRPEVVPVIRIWSEKKEGIVRLWIEDNGIGIPAEEQERIFNLFERLHCGKEYPGNGVGLAIVRRASERMGGRAGVISAPGQGSRFWLELACAEMEEKPDSIPAGRKAVAGELVPG